MEEQRLLLDMVKNLCNLGEFLLLFKKNHHNDLTTSKIILKTIMIMLLDILPGGVGERGAGGLHPLGLEACATMSSSF